MIIDVCKGCNNILNSVFDTPATKPSKALLDLEQTIHGIDVERLARWIIKTIVLWHHPRSRWKYLENRYPNRTPKNRWSLPRQDLIGLRDGTIPEGIQLWAAVVSPDAPVRKLPGSWGSNTAVARHGIIQFGIALRQGRPGKRSVLFHLQYQPAQPDEALVPCPAEDAGLVTRLWPAPPAQLSVQGLPMMGLAAADAYVRQTPFGYASQLTDARAHLDLCNETAISRIRDEAVAVACIRPRGHKGNVHEDKLLGEWET